MTYTNPAAAAMGHTSHQVAAADTAEDQHAADAANWADSINGAHRRISSAFSEAGLGTDTADEYSELYLASCRAYIAALYAASHAAKMVGDAHATMLGRINRARRQHHLPPIQSIHVS